MLLWVIIFTLVLAFGCQFPYNGHDTNARRMRVERKEWHMCTNGVNTGQFAQMIEQIDDHIKVERRWSHTLAHMAEDAGFATVGAKLHEAMTALDEVRAMLSDAKDALDDDAEAAANVTVNLV